MRLMQLRILQEQASMKLTNEMTRRLCLPGQLFLIYEIINAKSDLTVCGGDLL